MSGLPWFPLEGFPDKYPDEGEVILVSKYRMQEKVSKLAVFDIDGTIFRKNLHFELINELAWMKIFPLDARRQVIEMYTYWE